MAIRNSSPESMTPAEVFSQAVARRADLVLSQAHTQREIFAIGGLPFELSSPAGPDSWLGAAFMAGPKHAGLDVHRLTVWGRDFSRRPSPGTALGVDGLHRARTGGALFERRAPLRLRRRNQRADRAGPG